MEENLKFGKNQKFSYQKIEKIQIMKTNEITNDKSEKNRRIKYKKTPQKTKEPKIK